MLGATDGNREGFNDGFSLSAALGRPEAVTLGAKDGTGKSNPEGLTLGVSVLIKPPPHTQHA